MSRDQQSFRYLGFPSIDGEPKNDDLKACQEMDNPSESNDAFEDQLWHLYEFSGHTTMAPTGASSPVAPNTTFKPRPNYAPPTGNPSSNETVSNLQERSLSAIDWSYVDYPPHSQLDVEDLPDLIASSESAGGSMSRMSSSVSGSGSIYGAPRVELSGPEQLKNDQFDGGSISKLAAQITIIDGDDTSRTDRRRHDYHINPTLMPRSEVELTDKSRKEFSGHSPSTPLNPVTTRAFLSQGRIRKQGFKCRKCENRYHSADDLRKHERKYRGFPHIMNVHPDLMWISTYPKEHQVGPEREPNPLEKLSQEESMTGSDNDGYDVKRELVPVTQVDPHLDSTIDIRLDQGESSETTGALPPMANDSSFSDTTDSQVSTSDVNSRMALLLSKHRLMVKLMQEVYVMFDKGWSSSGSSHAGSETSSSSSPVRQDDSSNRSQASRKKSQKHGRDEQDPGDDKGRKRKRNDPSNVANEEQDNFACPFYQKDPTRFSCNTATGSKYRACTGPGFVNISRLKQHLRRVHNAPIQCTRCWMSMKSMHEMSEHANRENRCEPKDANPQGISQDKMYIISNRWGATWESIFEILFPGAPILSPYHRPADAVTASCAPSSPGSQSLSDFETYSRTELPRLIEANLQVMVDAEVAPIEESIKALLVDVVRRCQSTVAQNYGRIKTSKNINVTQAATDIMPAPITEAEPQQDVTSMNTNFFLSSFEEPPFREQAIHNPWDALWPLNGVGESATTGTDHPYLSQLPGNHSDSGYGTLGHGSECQCSNSQDSVGTADGHCAMCGLKKPFPWSFPEL